MVVIENSTVYVFIKINGMINMDKKTNLASLTEMIKTPEERRIFKKHMMFTCIGRDYYFVENDSCFCDRDLSEYDTIFWEIESVHDSIHHYYDNDRKIGLGTVARLLDKKFRELETDFLKYPKKLIILCDEVNDKILPNMHYGKAKPVRKTGMNVNFKNAKGVGISADIESLLHYKVILNHPSMDVLFTSKHGGKPVGGIVKRDNDEGVILYAPLINHQNLSYEDSYIPYLKFLDEVCDAYLLEEGEQSITLPEWSDVYESPYEGDTKVTLSEKEDLLEKTQSEIEELETRVLNLQRWKLLLSGTGIPLEDVVKSFFEELGCAVCKGPDGAADLLINYNGVLLVAEVKGLKKACGKPNVRQAAEWVEEVGKSYETLPKDRSALQKEYCDLLQSIDFDLDVLEGNNTEPKGLLILNTFLDTVPSDRDRAFPSNLEAFIVRKELSSIDTVDLFKQYRAFKLEGKEAIQILSAITETSGVVNF